MSYFTTPDLLCAAQELPRSDLTINYLREDGDANSAGQAIIYACTVALLAVSSVYAPQSSGGGLYLPADNPVCTEVVCRDAAALSTYDVISILRGNDMPIATIAEMVGVERKTVYSWLNKNVEAEPHNFLRAQKISQLFLGERPHALKYYARMWKRKMSNGVSLYDVLCAENIDIEQAKKVIAWLKPAVEKSLLRDERVIQKNFVSPASNLTIDLIAAG